MFIVYLYIYTYTYSRYIGRLSPRLPPKPSEIILCSNPNTARNTILFGKVAKSCNTYIYTIYLGIQINHHRFPITKSIHVGLGISWIHPSPQNEPYQRQLSNSEVHQPVIFEQKLVRQLWQPRGRSCFVALQNWTLYILYSDIHVSMRFSGEVPNFWDDFKVVSPIFGFLNFSCSLLTSKFPHFATVMPHFCFQATHV